MSYQNKIDVESLKSKHNIVDVIGAVVPLKKNGKNHTGLCPFHSEKSPSFTVEEGKQFYYCFGCGATGSVINFTMEFYGFEFMDACEHLGAEIERMPAAKVQQNIKKAKQMASYSTPIGHKQDIDASERFLSQCDQVGDFYADSDGLPHLPIINYQKQVINIAHLADKITFLAGGVSYGGFTFINNHSKNNVAVSNYEIGMLISNRYKVNVFICYSEANLKYVCKYAKPEHLKLKPVLWFGEDDAISDDMPCLWWDGDKLSKYELTCND